MNVCKTKYGRRIPETDSKSSYDRQREEVAKPQRPDDDEKPYEYFDNQYRDRAKWGRDVEETCQRLINAGFTVNIADEARHGTCRYFTEKRRDALRRIVDI